MGTAYRKPNIHNKLLESSRVLPIDGTPYKLAVPYSVGSVYNDSFQLGHITFHIRGERLVTDDVIPSSWFIDLSQETSVETDGAHQPEAYTFMQKEYREPVRGSCSETP